MTSKEMKKSNYLPEEVISEILSRLPVKVILQCSIVCKLWYTIIKNPNFIATHLQNTTLSSSNNRYFLCDYWDNRYQTRCISLFSNNENFEEYMQLQNPIFSAFRILGSCNGLICLLRYGLWYENCRIFLWNPLIRKSFSLPSSTSVLKPSTYFNFRNFIGFGFDSKTNDYKVLRILGRDLHEQLQFRAEVYSFNSNSWKDITQNAPNKYLVHKYMNSVFIRGALHWIARSRTKEDERNLMMVFQMSDEVFHEFTLPKCLELGAANSLNVKVFGESSIAIIDGHMEHEIDIWVIKEYGVVSSWVKLAKLLKQTTVLGFRNDREALVLNVDGCLASMNLNNFSRIRFSKTFSKECRGRLGFRNYVESMTLFDKGSDEDGKRFK